jgi:hypothetical protein
MRRPSFFHGVIVAGVLAFAMAATVAALVPFVGAGSLVRLAERTGVLTTLSLWSALAVTTWWLAPPLPYYVLIHVGAIWLVRSLYVYSGVLPALMDLGLSALAAAGFAWSISRTGSIFIATWTFFLIQALYVAIPSRIGTLQRQPVTASRTFERARKQADAALQQLMSR